MATAQPILQIHDLSRVFGGIVAVKDFSLEVYPGSIHGLIGPNGAGKTTTFNVISGFYPTDYPKFDIDMTVEEFREWEHDKEHSILGYRNKAFKSPCTGTMAPVHHTPWLEAMDDSMKAFLAVKGGKAAAE